MEDDPRKYDHCGCGGGCCMTLGYIHSILEFTLNDPNADDIIRDFAGDLLDEMGK